MRDPDGHRDSTRSGARIGRAPALRTPLPPLLVLTVGANLRQSVPLAMTRTVVLLSGGIDRAVVLRVISGSSTAVPLFVHYGQRAGEREAIAARYRELE